MKSNNLILVIGTVMLTMAAADRATAQLANDPANVAGNSAFTNSQGGSVGLRSPGSLVSAGIANQQARVLSPRLTFDNITEVEEIPFQRVFYVDAVNILFQNLNQVLLELGNTLLLRLGGNTQLPPTTQPATGGGDDTPAPAESKRTPVKLVDRILLLQNPDSPRAVKARRGQ
ncbi:MAG: hypothetical protein ACPGXK_04485 [Phycisphaerae bacterium]